MVALVDPNEPGHYPTCPWLALTGTFCPGCGSTRALHALAHGDLGTAWGTNPMVPALLPLLAAMWLAWMWRSLTGRPRRWAAPAWSIWPLVPLVLAFWCARNTEWGAFLAP